MKRLLFAAALATIAIGGAYTTSASGVYYDANNNEFDCTGTGPLCSEAINPQRTLWTEPNQQGESIHSSALGETDKFN